MKRLLFEHQMDYFEEDKYFYYHLDECVEKLESGKLTLKEFLDLGFNNSKMLKKSDENWSFDTGFKNSEKCRDDFGEYSEDLSDEMLKVKVINAGRPYEDGDGYYCADVYCVNDKDYELFDKELEKRNMEL